MPKDSLTSATRLLADLRPGDFATITALHAGDEALHQRLLALGMLVGKTINVVRQAPFGGPLQVRVGSTDILLRLVDATKISIQRL